MRLHFDPTVLLPSSYTITLAGPEHLAVVAEIEMRAAERFEGVEYAGVADETVPLAEFISAMLDRRWWVALWDGVPVGFVLVKMLGPEHPHVEEMDVVAEHGRRGLGTALLRTALSWLAQSGYREISLTTFRDVPWNAPFYARLGFEEIPPGEIGEELKAVIARETGRGLDPARRVAMRYRMERALEWEH